MKTKRVAIVGAGASGIPSAKQALSYGFEPTVFEASNDIGGLWRYKPEETDESSVMKSTVINTSKEMNAYSDFPPPDDFANFMHNRKMLDYLRSYASSFNFSKFLRMNHTVSNVRRSSTYANDGSWLVSYQTPEGEQRDEQFDAVLLCTGHHTHPYWPPEWPGQKEYTGQITHSHSYKDFHGFEDKNVVVVGVGNSGVDIAVELSRISREVYLATRRGTWVMHRNLDKTIPYDLVFNTRFMSVLYKWMPSSLVSWFLRQIVERRLDHEKFGLKPKHDIFGAHFTVNDELPNRLSCGTVRIRSNIRCFTRNDVIFDDGTIADNVDHVILATGYSFEFPLLEQGTLIKVTENDVSLYLNMYLPELADHNTLAVIGLIQPLGSILPISEMQARLFFDVLNGRSALPSPIGMHVQIGQYKTMQARRYVQSRRHTIQVDYVPYMDKIADLMGCKPKPLRYLLTGDISLFSALLFGPNVPYVYRLCGPRLWPDARAAILDVQRRVVSGMRGMKLVACRRCNKFADCSIMETTTTGNGKSIGLGLEHSDLVPLETAVVQMESSPCCHSCSKQIKGEGNSYEVVIMFLCLIGVLLLMAGGLCLVWIFVF